MISVILSIATVALLGALAAAIWWATGVLSLKIGEIQPLDTPAPAPDFAHVNALAGRIDGLDKAVQELYQAVADGIDHVDRNEKRVRGIVTGAKRRFAAEGYEDPGVDAEADSLPRDDAAGGGGEGMPPMSNDVGIPENPYQGVPGTIPVDFGS